VKGIFIATKWASDHQSITGFATLAGTVLGLIAALRSGDSWINGAGAALAIFAGVILLYNYRLRLAKTARWLTWKFVLGMSAGAIVTAVLYPPVSQAFRQATQRQGTIVITHTDPQSGFSLKSVYDGLDVFFSKDLTDAERRKVSVSLTPDFPFERIWLYDGVNQNRDIHQLGIEPKKYFSNDRRPRFDYDTEYTVTIKGAVLKERTVVTFRTPKEEPTATPTEQDGTGQPATRPESKSEGSDKPQPESEGRSR
jgi:hypothetical protein